MADTAGHMDESIFIAIHDANFGEGAVGVFTGDALFFGDVGRTDFYPDRAEEVAGLLYESILKKMVPIGDQALIFPVPGAGSVCGESMASREFFSVGDEGRSNPRPQLDREASIAAKISEHHLHPPILRDDGEAEPHGNPPA